MADPLLDLLQPNLDQKNVKIDSSNSQAISQYLSRLTSLHLHEVDDSEAAFLSSSLRTITRNLQTLSNRTYRGFASSAEKFSSLTSDVPKIVSQTEQLRNSIPAVEEASSSFAAKHGKSAQQNEVLEKRRQALLLARNSDRIADILDLPNLLSSCVSSAGSSAPGQGANFANYGTALELYSHIQRLSLLYPDSKVVKDISAQADEVIGRMTSDLIASLRQQNVKLAGGLRTIGWLRRICPQLTKSPQSALKPGARADEDLLATLFLMCRLSSLENMLSALDPFKELADREIDDRKRRKAVNGTAAARKVDQEGQQTIKYLKKYIEIFREQSFAIISTYKSIFPTLMPGEESGNEDRMNTQSTETKQSTDMPPPISTFPMHLLGLLSTTLRAYLPNVQDSTVRESLLIQVLYCANSLGRLGADFSMMLALLEEDMAAEIEKSDGAADVIESNAEEEEEWVRVMLKHRELSGRLEQLSSGLDKKQSRAVSATVPAVGAG